MYRLLIKTEAGKRKNRRFEGYLMHELVSKLIFNWFKTGPFKTPPCKTHLLKHSKSKSGNYVNIMVDTS